MAYLDSKDILKYKFRMDMLISYDNAVRFINTGVGDLELAKLSPVVVKFKSERLPAFYPKVF